jgi:pyrroloquinoline quinone biosynthesis protein B
MWAQVLGSAAGGGFPQWNCACPNCAGVRAGTVSARPRTQASLAVSPDRRRWFLVNATPDIAVQLARLAPDGAAVRRSPVEAVLLTDAELDHVTGLLSLREGARLTVYATAWIHRAAAPILDVLGAYVDLDRVEVTVGDPVTLDPASGLACRAVATGSTKRPRYAAHLPSDPSAVVGYRFAVGDGPALLYLPCVPDLSEPLRAEVASAHTAFVDGTCWTDGEMALVGKPEKTSRSMGHAPVSGADGTLDRLAGLASRRVYTHLNNTNPLLVASSPERRAVEAAGVEVAHDGMEVEVP